MTVLCTITMVIRRDHCVYVPVQLSLETQSHRRRLSRRRLCLFMSIHVYSLNVYSVPEYLSAREAFWRRVFDPYAPV
jgi:hypothetical protein